MKSAFWNSKFPKVEKPIKKKKKPIKKQSSKITPMNQQEC
jgi:hypothetical protein